MGKPKKTARITDKERLDWMTEKPRYVEMWDARVRDCFAVMEKRPLLFFLEDNTCLSIGPTPRAAINAAIRAASRKRKP